MKPAYWLALIGLVAALGYGCEQRRIGALKAEIRNLTQAHALLKVQAESLSKAKAKRVVVVHESRRATDSVLATVLPTATFPAERVLRFIRIERQACDALVATVESACAVKDQQIANLTEQNKKLVKLSKTGKWLGFLPKPHVQMGVCFAGGRFTPCPSVGFNIF